MQKRPVVLKIFVVLILVIGLFHFSGVETAFCKDGVPQSMVSHDCSVCQHGIYTADLKSDISLLSMMPPQGAFSELNKVLHPQDISFAFFRPPISL